MGDAKDAKKVKFPDIMRKPACEVESDIPGLSGYMFQGPDGSQLILWECEERVEVQPHKHDFDEYCLVVEGACEETIEGETMRLGKGDEIVIPAGKMHWAVMGPHYRAIDYFGDKRVSYKKT